jgi:hypothetical protein
MRPLRTWSARVLLAAGLGLVTSVALAWALAAWLPHRGLTYRTNLVGDPSGYITVFEFSRRGMIRRDWHAGYSLSSELWAKLDSVSTLRLHNKTAAQDRSWGALPAALDHPTATSAGAEDARGWPWLCLSCSINERVIAGDAAGSASPDGLVLSRLTSATTVASIRVLPLRPIWPGLAADAGAFAVAWGLTFAGWLVLRRWLRRRRGLCPWCAYELEGARRCPECGWPAERRESA